MMSPVYTVPKRSMLGCVHLPLEYGRMTSSVSIAKRKGFVKTPDGHIHYWAVGSREPVLLLHQSPRSVDEYVEVADILSSSKHVIALDALGYGNSDKPPRPYFIEDYARSVVTVMDALELEKASIGRSNLRRPHSSGDRGYLSPASQQPGPV